MDGAGSTEGMVQGAAGQRQRASSSNSPLLPSLAAAALTVAMGITAPNQASAQVIQVYDGHGYGGGHGHGGGGYGGGYGYTGGYRYAPPPPPAYGYGGYRPWHHHHHGWDRPCYAPRGYYGGRW